MYAYQSVAKHGADQRKSGGKCYRIDPVSGGRIEITKAGSPKQRKGSNHA